MNKCTSMYKWKHTCTRTPLWCYATDISWQSTNESGPTLLVFPGHVFLLAWLCVCVYFSPSLALFIDIYRYIHLWMWLLMQPIVCLWIIFLAFEESRLRFLSENVPVELEKSGTQWERNAPSTTLQRMQGWLHKHHHI